MRGKRESTVERKRESRLKRESRQEKAERKSGKGEWERRGGAWGSGLTEGNGRGAMTLMRPM